MESLRVTYRDDEEDEEDEEEEEWTNGHDPTTQTPKETPKQEIDEEEEEEEEEVEDDEEDDDDELEERVSSVITDKLPVPESHPIIPSSELSDEDEDANPQNPRKKQKPLACFTDTPAPPPPTETPPAPPTVSLKKPPKKKPNNVWTKSTSRKGKKLKKNSKSAGTKTHEDAVLVTPIPRFPDKSDDSIDAKICLSKVYKAEKVELSEDRLTAGSSKGYRMVRATRGVLEGAWFFEIRVSKLGDTGHMRLGWSTEKGDLQAPVGYDGNSFGYRDVDGSKIHKALREKYGEEGYVEGDVIGCYINLPEGSLYAPKPPQLVWYKGQRYAYAADGKEDPPKVVPGSEISFFRNGTCQGVAFKDLYGGHYYPAASMYTLPNQPNCVVKFNFGPDFDFFPQDFDGRPIPTPMIEVPYHGFDSRFDSPTENGLSSEKKH